MHKANNQPHKKILDLGCSWVNIVKNCKILTLQVDFLCQIIRKSDIFNLI